MSEDEQATVDTLKQSQQAIGHVIERHQGRILAEAQLMGTYKKGS